MPNRSYFLILLFAWLLPVLLHADTTDADATELDAVLVTGEQPGPGLWRITSHGNELWVLGILSPLPAKMHWRSDQTEAVIARSRQVLAPPSVEIDIGLFKTLTLIPALLRARKSPDGRSLDQSLTPPMYARWTALKARYLPNSDGVEKFRPIVAARELYTKALEKNDLETNDDIWERVKQAAKRHDVTVVPISVSPRIEDPKGTLKQLQQIAVEQESSCMSATLERLETDLPSMRLRANRWATGDIDGLRAMPHVDQRLTCFDAIASVPSLREQLFKTRTQLNDLWIAAAQTALANSPSTFAVLPIDQLMRADGVLARLKQRGYEIQEPK
jgi:uncharacterized protein YbaP (TraB family)